MEGGGGGVGGGGVAAATRGCRSSQKGCGVIQTLYKNRLVFFFFFFFFKFYVYIQPFGLWQTYVSSYMIIKTWLCTLYFAISALSDLCEKIVTWLSRSKGKFCGGFCKLSSGCVGMWLFPVIVIFFLNSKLILTLFYNYYCCDGDIFMSCDKNNA